ncbi:transglutaminase family protein [Xanthomonas hortorum]|uniref:Transglutaminase-like domain-containing protein n=1 Tax=Xanthomonas hortorum pv. hederae TaxID=453603 RepID=A0A9X4BV97_9XANT|nr:transglutaminase family protein [Xanthomonas hortorum]MCE4369702.1 transglutaminase-like domain-containing protein [Xanthomonas hortorum pv. hederae]MDC8640215.1 transglutaminase-like domain-containing protein [Xanthomonas hortorum pv. hederae]
MGTLLASLASVAWAAGDHLDALRAQFELPDEQVDYAAAKLAVDQLIHPSTDAAAVRRELDAWERAVRGNAPASPTARQVLDALLETLYAPGPWNQGEPFTYDLSDPLGRDPGNKRLATYLATRQGNCVSMPILVVILGQRLGLPVALATAPSHVMVKFADDAQQAWLNVEATAGGFKYDSSYERETGISEAALDNGLYLRPLSPREGVGVIASTLMEHYAARNDGDALMAVADLALAANPKDAVAMVWKANAYYLQTQQRIRSRYPGAADVPPALHDEYRRLTQENLAWFARAESLGWAQKTPEQEAGYLQSIQRERARRGQ